MPSCTACRTSVSSAVLPVPLSSFSGRKSRAIKRLAITDECTLAGIVRAWQAAKSVELPLIIGSEVRIENGPKLVLLVENLEGYQTLCRLITRARRRTQKGQYQVLREDFSEPLPGLLALWVPDAVDDFEQGHWLKQTFAERLWLAVQLHRGQDDTRRLAALLTLARRTADPGGGQRRCAHARPWAARLAGHHDRDPPSPAGGRGRAASASQWRAACAQPRGPAIDLIRKHCSTKR